MSDTQDPGPRLERPTSLADVARDPNTALLTLYVLWESDLRAAFENPLFALLLLEDPNLWEKLPLPTLRSLVRQPEVPASVLEWASQQPDDGLRQAVAENPNTSSEVLARLANDWRRLDLATQAAIARHRSTPQGSLSVLNRSLGRQDPVRDALAQNPSTPPQLLLQFASDRDPQVRSLAARNPGLPARFLRGLVRLGSTPDLASEAPPDPALPPEEIEAILRSLLGQGGEWAERLSLKHPRVSWQALGLFYVQSERDALAASPDPLAATLARLARPFHERHIREAVARQPQASPELLLELAGDANPRIREGVAANPSTPAETLAKLAEDEAPEVRRAASRPQLGSTVTEIVTGK